MSDSSVGFVEPGMSFVIGVKEGEWKELKQYREESVLYQLGTSLVTFSASIGITVYVTETESKLKIYVLIGLLFLALGIGITVLYFWFIEHKKKNNVVKKVEGRAAEQYGNAIDLS